MFMMVLEAVAAYLLLQVLYWLGYVLFVEPHQRRKWKKEPEWKDYSKVKGLKQ
jgi:hypothetical protein